MRIAGARSELAVSTSTASSFTAALFVRDHIGLPVAGDIPRLAPTVPYGSSRRDSITVAAWNAWWSDIEGAEAGHSVIPNDSALQNLLDDVGTDARSWGDSETDAVAASYQPDWLPTLLASTSGSGRHDTEIIPVVGRWSFAPSDRRLLVSSDLYRDHDAMDTLWRARIGALVA